MQTATKLHPFQEVPHELQDQILEDAMQAGYIDVKLEAQLLVERMNACRRRGSSYLREDECNMIQRRYLDEGLDEYRSFFGEPVTETLEYESEIFGIQKKISCCRPHDPHKFLEFVMLFANSKPAFEKFQAAPLHALSLTTFAEASEALRAVSQALLWVKDKKNPIFSRDENDWDDIGVEHALKPKNLRTQALRHRCWEPPSRYGENWWWDVWTTLAQTKPSRFELSQTWRDEARAIFCLFYFASKNSNTRYGGWAFELAKELVERKQKRSTEMSYREGVREWEWAELWKLFVSDPEIERNWWNKEGDEFALEMLTHQNFEGLGHSDVERVRTHWSYLYQKHGPEKVPDLLIEERSDV